MTKPTVYSLVLYHMFVVILVSCLAVDFYGTRSYGLLIQSLLVYLTTLLLFLLFNKKMPIVLIAVVGIVCAYESVLGLFQIFGIIDSSRKLFGLTGSFENPGPYGGFLAVCASLTATYCIKIRNNVKSRDSLKLMFWFLSGVSVLCLIILPSTQSRAAIAGLCVSMIVFTAGKNNISVKIQSFLKRNFIWVLPILVILGFGTYKFKRSSADSRLFIGKISILTMYYNGWKGAGVGHFGKEYGKIQTAYFKKQIEAEGSGEYDWSVIDQKERLTAECPGNAFNEYLTIGVEEGVAVMLLFIGILVLAIVVSLKRCTVWCYGLTTMSVFALFSYPLHLELFQILMAILFAACICDNDTMHLHERNRTWAIVSLSVAVLILSFTFGVRIPEIRKFKQAEAAWKETTNWHLKGQYDYVVEDGDSLFNYLKDNADFLFMYGQSLNMTGNYTKSDSILKMGTEISCDPMFWDIMGNNSMALGNYHEAEELYKRAFYMVPNRLYPLYLLARLYHTQGDTVRFLSMAHRVESFAPKVESVLIERMRSEINEIKNSLDNLR